MAKSEQMCKLRSYRKQKCRRHDQKVARDGDAGRGFWCPAPESRVVDYKRGQSPAGTIESLPFPFCPCPAISIRPLVGSPTRLSTVADFQSSLRDCVLISYPTRDSGGRHQTPGAAASIPRYFLAVPTALAPSGPLQYAHSPSLGLNQRLSKVTLHIIWRMGLMPVFVGN